LAILLEVSADKPGNVSRAADFGSTRYEHFLASAVAVEPSFALAARRGIMVSNRKATLSEIRIGEVVEDAVAKVNSWQRGGNTLLGTILLLCPIAAAAGMEVGSERFSVSRLREKLGSVVNATTAADALRVFDAINLANPGGLRGKAPTLDVTDPSSKTAIVEKGISLLDVFRISAPYDTVSREWVENYPTTFDLGLTFFNQQLKETNSLRISQVHTFLKVLSEVPDTLVARKAGPRKAKQVSQRAAKILGMGGLTTEQGRREVSRFNESLRKHANLLNPGTTADIIATVLAIKILDGFRP
jgi:triphosphoribosyl-dephospho-CoA synthase